jgi:hypothetical protein
MLLDRFRASHAVSALAAIGRPCPVTLCLPVLNNLNT